MSLTRWRSGRPFSAPGESSRSMIPGCFSRSRVICCALEVEALSQVPVSACRPGVPALGRLFLCLLIGCCASLLGSLVEPIHQLLKVDQTPFPNVDAGKPLLLLHQPQGVLGKKSCFCHFSNGHKAGYFHRHNIRSFLLLVVAFCFEPW